MGVINRSPNSFFGVADSLCAGLTCARQMRRDGVDIIDVGGEATNPFVDLTAEAPDVNDEIARVVPLIEAIRAESDVALSVDTSSPAVMAAALAAGASMINDQRALMRDGALSVVADAGVPVCLMHFTSPVRTPASSAPAVLLRTIKDDLQRHVERCLAAGIAENNIIIDPGFGGGHFGKNTPENFYLLKHFEEFVAMGYPVLAGWSRKSMIGEALGNVPPTARLYGSIAAATILAMKGASMLRVHDVKATVDAVTIVQAM